MEILFTLILSVYYTNRERRGEGDCSCRTSNNKTDEWLLFEVSRQFPVLNCNVYASRFRIGWIKKRYFFTRLENNFYPTNGSYFSTSSYARAKYLLGIINSIPSGVVDNRYKFSFIAFCTKIINSTLEKSSQTFWLSVLS